jgi:cell division protein FtsW
LQRARERRERAARQENAEVISLEQRRRLRAREERRAAEGRKRKSTSPDLASAGFWLMGIVTVLVLFGLVMIYSSSSNLGFLKYGSSFYFLGRQALAAAIGFFLMVGLARRDYHQLVKLSPLLCLVGLVLLVLVFFPGIGYSAYGSRRFLRFGIQPSEFAKFALVLFATYSLCRRDRDVSDLVHLVFPTLLATLLIVALILAEPDMGTAVIIATTILVMLVMAGARWRHIFALSCLGLLAALCYALSSNYRLERITALLDPWKDAQGSGFHLIQSLLALGSGGIKGLGLGMSRQKFMYLPNAHNDFIFSIIGEELGFIGTIFVVAIFLAFIIIGIKIARRAKDPQGRLLAMGITFLVSAQALVNMGAVTGLVPVTGVTLPFVSYGGSSLVIFMASVGILVNISTQGRAMENRTSRRREMDAHSDLRRRNRWASLSSPRSGRGAGIA